MNENGIISSRRNFLKNMAYGSLLMVGGLDIASAKAKAKQVVSHKVSHKKVEVAHTLSHQARVHDTLHKHLAASSHKAAIAPVHARAQTSSPKIIHNALFDNSVSHKVLALHNMHTGDQLKLTYFEEGRYIKDALHEINHLFRDYHDGSIHPIDPALLDQLHDLKHVLEVRKPFNIVSAYRSPATNADLRKHSDGVAKNSLHMEGRAIDIRIEGVDTRRIRNAALAMQRGGVGYYGRSNFVHLDTGSVRTWGG